MEIWLVLKNVFLGVFTKIWDPENFTFASETAKIGQTSEAWDKVKKNCLERWSGPTPDLFPEGWHHPVKIVRSFEHLI